MFRELRVEHVQVGAGGEGVTPATDDHDPHIVVLFGPVERGAHRDDLLQLNSS